MRKKDNIVASDEKYHFECVREKLYLIYNYFNCFASTSFILVTWDPSYSITFVAVITCFLKLSCIETVMEHLSFSHYTD